MAKINIKIEGIPYQVEEGLTILEAAKACGYEIPSLCAFLPRLSCRGNGRKRFGRVLRLPGKRGYGNHNIISQGGCRKKNIC